MTWDGRSSLLPPEDRSPVISAHVEPQPSPQEYGCGCVAVTYVTDRDYLRGEKPFEMRLADDCGTPGCLVVHRGPWWCPACSHAHDSTLSTNHGIPACPRCGTPLERRGKGDDDPDA